MTGWWLALAVAAVGTYVLKLAGMSLPESVLGRPVVQRVAGLLPVSMLAALVLIGMVDGGGRYAVDWRVLAGVAAAVVALLFRRGFLTVFLIGVGVCAALTAIFPGG